MCFRKNSDVATLLDDAKQYAETMRRELRTEINGLINNQCVEQLLIFRRDLTRALEDNFSDRDWETDGNGVRRLFLTMLMELLVEKHVKDLNEFRRRCYIQQWLQRDAENIDAVKYHPAPHLTPDTTTKEDLKMPTYATSPSNGQPFYLDGEAVENRTFIFGVPAEDLNKQKLYSLIVELESKISGLSVVKNKPKSLKRDIKELEAQIEAIVEFTDAKFAPKE